MISDNPYKPLKIGLCGASGKMGQAVIALCELNQDKYVVSSNYGRPNTLDDLKSFCQNSNVIIDFTSPMMLLHLIKVCAIYNKPIVIGTTGLTREHFNLMTEISEQIPILYSANMSLGANLIAMLSHKIAKILPKEYDIEIVDYHHRYKKDSPSGTSLMIGKQIAQAKNLDFEENAALTRHSNTKRLENQIGFSSVRGGGIPGEHQVIFAGDNDVISINHQVLNREIFAKGALCAASWLSTKKPGLYSMMDVINLNYLD